ncbi:MAG TPA: hypothetical protein VMM35_04165 [Longimicrobiales bacterium]|nr:hypothetical protein [Longimicrobiales bacterium]
MRNAILALSLVVLLAPEEAAAQAVPPSGSGARAAGDRLYGRVLTAEGDRLEGYLRWDRNETHWADILDGQKEIPHEYDVEAERLDEDLRRRRERERSLSLPGLRITWDEDDGDPRTTAAGIRFGHIRSLQPVDDRRALLVLASGEEVGMVGMSTDIGRSFRGLVVEDALRGEVELRWRDLDRVDFLTAPSTARAPAAERLHGTLRTRSGVELTGWVAWDMDETLDTDILDGDEGGRRLEIAFGSLAAIRPEGRDAARVTLRSGEELVLDGTNDVDSDNRGIEITDPLLGRAIVQWEELGSLRFHAPAAAGWTAGSAAGPARAHAAFDGGRPLHGTVETRTGELWTGHVRWDNDEAFTWEILDGRSEGVDYDIELGLVGSIERVGSDSARVELVDGRTLLLEESNDVNHENQGVFVRPESGETILVRWPDLARVTFTR